MNFVIYHPGAGGLGSQLSSKLLGLALSYNNNEYNYHHIKWDHKTNRLGHNYENNPELEKNIENSKSKNEFMKIRFGL